MNHKEIQHMFLNAGLIQADALPIPDSSLQHYRLTASGKQLAQHLIEPSKP